MNFWIRCASVSNTHEIICALNSFETTVWSVINAFSRGLIPQLWNHTAFQLFMASHNNLENKGWKSLLKSAKSFFLICVCPSSFHLQRNLKLDQTLYHGWSWHLLVRMGRNSNVNSYVIFLLLGNPQQMFPKHFVLGDTDAN